MLWLILVCINCDVDAARATGWRGEAVLSSPDSFSSWRAEDPRRFETRATCLAAIQRDRPSHGFTAPNSYGQVDPNRAAGARRMTEDRELLRHRLGIIPHER